MWLLRPEFLNLTCCPSDKSEWNCEVDKRGTWPVKSRAVLVAPYKRARKVKRGPGREPAAARLRCSFTTPLRFPFLSSLPGTFVFFDCPGEQKHARKQQPYWDRRAIKLCRLWRGSLVNKSAADQSNQAAIRSSTPPLQHPPQPPPNTSKPENNKRPALSIEHVGSQALITRSSTALVLGSIKPVILSASCLGDMSTDSS